MPVPPIRIAVAIASYKRPDDLEALLTSIESLDGDHDLRVIVVDNDARGTAERVARASALNVDYVVEEKPGIAAARNASLDRLPPDATHVVFVDDDEVVPTGWMDALLDVADRYDAEIVCGPVRTIFPPDAPRWIERGGYIQRSPEAEGPTSRTPATNNTLLSLVAYERAGSPRFDESFSATGGSDTDFFTRLIAASGAKVAWAPSAEVTELAPPDRLRFRWIMRRYIRINNVSGRLMLRSTPPWKLAVRAVGHIAMGTAKTAVALVTGKGLRLRDTAQITRGLGWIGAVSGRHVQEYQRPTS